MSLDIEKARFGLVLAIEAIHDKNPEHCKDAESHELFTVALTKVNALIAAVRLDSLTATRSRMAVAKYGASVKVTRDVRVEEDAMYLADSWGDAVAKQLLDSIDIDIVDARAEVAKAERATT